MPSIPSEHHAALQRVELQQLRRAAHVCWLALVCPERLEGCKALPELLVGPLCSIWPASGQPCLAHLHIAWREMKYPQKTINQSVQNHLKPVGSPRVSTSTQGKAATGVKGYCCAQWTLQVINSKSLLLQRTPTHGSNTICMLVHTHVVLV